MPPRTSPTGSGTSGWPAPEPGARRTSALASGGTSPGPSAGPASPGLATPEDAIRGYLAGVATADVIRILGVAAIEEMSSGFHVDLQTDRLQAMQVTRSLAPATSTFYVGLNQAIQTSWLLGQVRNLAYSLLSTESIDGTLIVPADKARADAFAAQVDVTRLANLTVEDIRFPNATLQDDARYLANAAALASIYDADEMTERLALVSLDGRQYAIGFTLLRYGNDWKVEPVIPAGGHQRARHGAADHGTGLRPPHIRPVGPPSGMGRSGMRPLRVRRRAGRPPGSPTWPGSPA